MKRYQKTAKKLHEIAHEYNQKQEKNGNLTREAVKIERCLLELATNGISYYDPNNRHAMFYEPDIEYKGAEGLKQLLVDIEDEKLLFSSDEELRKKILDSLKIIQYRARNGEIATKLAGKGSKSQYITRVNAKRFPKLLKHYPLDNAHTLYFNTKLDENNRPYITFNNEKEMDRVRENPYLGLGDKEFKAALIDHKWALFPSNREVFDRPSSEQHITSEVDEVFQRDICMDYYITYHALITSFQEQNIAMPIDLIKMMAYCTVYPETKEEQAELESIVHDNEPYSSLSKIIPTS